jgi:uncharacterized membrane protein
MSDPLQDPIPPTPPTYVPPAPAAASSGLADNIAAALAYITVIPAIIFLVIEPYNRIPLVRFHSFQSIGLAVVAFILRLGLVFLPLNWMLYSLLSAVIGIGLFIAWIIAIIKAYKGEFYKLPIIGDFAEKQARG